MASTNRLDFLHQLYNHVALPRDVPGKEDGNLHHIDAAFSLQASQTLNVSGTVSKSILMKQFRTLDRHKMLVLHLNPQNCGLLIYYQFSSVGETSVVFEAFETSATADKVLAAKSALQWDFPGSAVSISELTFNDLSFQDALATFLEQASTEYVTKFAAVTWKAAAKLVEIRDTSDPAIISGLLMAILEANGTTINVPQLRKRVRDTVTFENARKPWRRSAFYLVLRVATQRYLYHHLGAQEGRKMYKTIMCVLHAQLLENALRRIPLEAAFFLRQKLGRRLAKLSSDLHSSNNPSICTQPFGGMPLERDFEKTLGTTGAYLKQVWRTYQRSRERQVPELRRYVNNNELRLNLTSSGKILRNTLVEYLSFPRRQEPTAASLLDTYQQSVTSAKPYMEAVSGHISSSKYHEDVVLPAKCLIQYKSPRIIELSGIIREYVRIICTGDQTYTYQKSQQLLCLMELWVLMDKAAVAGYQLLLDYHPGFESDILDPIELLTLEEMTRVQEVRRYLSTRCRSHTVTQSNTIFDDPDDDCFAVRFYDNEGLEGELSAMRKEIEDAAEQACIKKETEWEEKSTEYKKKTLKLNEKECIYDPVIDRDLRVARPYHREPCEWHKLHRELKNMRIQIFEHPLPSYEPAAKATLFELQCPEEFAAYRDATWLILSSLCHKPVEHLDRISLIRNYSQLRPYANNTHCQVTLGSYKKAHLESHYANWAFPIALQEIIRTCGLKPRYYDSDGTCWTDRLTKASFWHHFPVKFPLNSPFSTLGLDYAAWPTSNQIQASQAKCPQGLGIHEFTAFQDLLVGTHARWINLLRELGSSNINFSSESTWVIVSRLVLQQGPSCNQTSEYTDIHSSLADNDLSTALLTQIDYRLQGIRRNWREPIQMEILITILLKVVSLTRDSKTLSRAMELLHQARTTTDGWRTELQAIVADDPNVLQWVIWASLLCKRTFHTEGQLLGVPEHLQTYLDASISLHYNLSVEIGSMPCSLQNAITRDVLFAYENRDLIRTTLLAHPETFIASLKAVWHVPGSFECTKLALETISDTWWMSLTLRPGTEQYSTFVHFNYIYGTLLINGKEMGTLPLSYRTHSTFQHMFGTKNPIVYPSPLRGMDFALCEMMPKKHRIHLGYRGGQVIVRADVDGHLLEFIPHGIFRPDLPLPLVEGCYHWLHIDTGEVEIRQKDKWTSKRKNWWLRRLYQDGSYRAVRQFQEPEEVILLEPRSPLVHDIAQIFSHFETPSQMLVWLAQDGKVNVELKRMELSFFINFKGQLQSRRLGAIIWHKQDCGTWYGLRNKIMIQSISNQRHTSILVPLGNFKVFRDGPHVCVDIEMGSGEYLKYSINDTLGRIDCAPEPRLLYTKALLHAYTSHVIADPLTGRTGTEEALHLLHSAAYQPWNPLPTHIIDLLNRISDLSPKRGYYPPEDKCMETVRWNADCTTYMQDDGFVTVIARILRKSSDLSHFFFDREVQERPELPTQVSHLAARALARSATPKRKTASYQEDVYCTRDTRTSSQGFLNVLEISKLLLSWQPSCAMDTSLVALLHDAPVVGGYDKLYRKCLLSDHFAVDLRAEWGALAQKALQCNWDDKFSLMFLFSVLAFSPDANLSLLRVLVSFAMLPEIRAIPAPKYPAYFHFRADGAPPTSYFVSLMAKARIAFSETGFKKRSQLVKAQSLHEPSVDKACELLATSISAQWPSFRIDPKRLPIINSEYLDVGRALADISPEWTRLTQNHELCTYLEQVQKVLSRASLQHGQFLPPVVTESELSPAAIYPQRSRANDDLTLRHLLKFNIPSNTVAMTTTFPVIESYARALNVRSGNIVHSPGNHYRHMNNFREQKMPHAHSVAPQSKEISMLREIVARFKDPESFVQCRYAKELEASINALQKRIMNKKDVLSQQYHQIRADEIMSAKRSASAAAEHIRRTLRHSDPQAKWLQMVDLWPSMTFINLLGELRESSKTEFGKGSKEALVAFGLAMTKLQRLLRIADAQKRHKDQQVQDEWGNEGHTNWDPLNHPDWLLLEIDGDVLLREEQVDVALATVSPPSGRNSVLQLLMGKGKTSCILPMAAALLANGTDLARVVVPRALLLQSAQAMQVKLGGLVNRELIHVPFSRRTPPKESLIHLYGKLHTKLRDRRGIILALPEHILSFKLSGLQQLCDANLEAASKMMDTQRWLDQHARDVLDECDVSLAIRTQLIYPSGTQMTVDGHPMRWQIIQAVLQLVKDFSTTVQSRYPHSIEIVKRGFDGFPLLYFLRQNAEEYLLCLLVTIICKGQTPSILPCAEYPLDMRQDIEAYISVPTVRSHIVSRISNQFQDKPKLMRTINLLRGLFVHRILLTTLKKRWNVQYGLHPVRAPIAVPYLAKGVPSPTAEWGHPDVAITLTCLSFYYQGLNISQFKESFEHLAKTDEPSIQYEKWFPEGCYIPRELEDYAAINAEDVRQLSELYQVVRYSACLIDFYLNNFVFPKYAKTFKLKLQASGWNLFPSVATRKMQAEARVTGFSGTNDSRHQLPLLIQQQDMAKLEHTNAEVPYYLLASRNQSYVRMASPNGARWTELDLLRNLATPAPYAHSNRNHGVFYGANNQFGFQQQRPIRILLDAGAQVLEHSNKAFARAWLDADYEAAAAVYFDDDHRVWVLYRTNKTIPLVASPFADNLDRCVVYLDESHCRGTDLKFPPDARAALTLGQHLTKDALVQAAMRLRLLGQTQSVTFYSPPEVHQGILDRLKETGHGYRPTSGDVLQWVFGQTCDIMEQSEPSFFAQTSQYMQQEQARLEHPDYLRDSVSRDAFLSKVRIKETLSLKQLYQPKAQRQNGSPKTSKWHPVLEGISTELLRRKKHFQDRGSAVHASALEEVEIEQEREAEREIESEVEHVREVQQSLAYDAAKLKKLHEDVMHFAKFGRLVAGSDAYRPMFSQLARTELGLKHTVNPSMKSGLWISAQFNRTIETFEPNDNYIRSPHWILWSTISEQALLVSPEEADNLIPILQHPRLLEADNRVHLIVYAAPVTRRMLHFNQLNYYATPPLPTDFHAPVWLRIELGLFSGRLYLEWDEYHKLLEYLGLYDDLSQHPEKPPFATKPLTFLYEWITLRRKGQDFEHTPMGFITTGKPLTEKHPFFRVLASEDNPERVQTIARHAPGYSEEEQDDDEHDDQGDEDFVPAVEHVDESEDEEEFGSSGDEEFQDAEDAE
ncbi:hypothetical protein COCSADRAFT_342034 [Bipolaris sorokiniana ND90Pr]|uniref:ubiquitinyl hydrolase 1 n=1 Tax=Cochliobolus sativus (strain ND90Pr / ATCC 201652) TaxID=665912 RepID=M2T6A1_COCSN|nr:uncharacterized protein COCSADRAFT_342034 [Bipolaris sorokiniana ND90Pr]EMD69950.1 hypothetical protein COCSADRAFT_342034 [Bipolaris sorokiniana ND90Pr]